jgi:hypothetical protein
VSLLLLQAYASILYLHMPEQFRIMLRGELVEHHSMAMDLKFTEYIIYKPQIGVTKDAANKEVLSKPFYVENYHDSGVFYLTLF